MTRHTDPPARRPGWPAFITVHTPVGDLELPAPATVADALSHPALLTALHDSAVSTALNGLFVPREQRASQALQHGDTLLCFQAITGG